MIKIISTGFTLPVTLCLSALIVSGCGGGDSDGASKTSSSSRTSLASSLAVSSSPSSVATASSEGFSSSVETSSVETSSVETSSSVATSSSASVSSLDQCLTDATEASASAAAPLPQLQIDIENGAQVLVKSQYLAATYAFSGKTEPATTGDLEIRGRGNSTWDWVKKPYRLKLDKAASFDGLPAHRHFVLLANYGDKTLVRNEATFKLAHLMQLPFTPRSETVELSLNGAYQGVYQLTEHIRVGKNRVDIPELEVTDTDADAITGGYLLEVDFRMSHSYCAASPWDVNCVGGQNLNRLTTYCIDSNQGMPPACVDTPDSLHEADWSAQREYITGFINDFEAALFGAQFASSETGYAAYLNVDSAIDYYLLNEFVKNPDGATTSFWLYKDRGQKLVFGPVWDFDLASGNAGYANLDNPTGFHTRQGAWFARLLEDPAFSAKVAARWQTLKAEGVFDEYFAFIETRTQALQVAQAKNYCVWDITDFADWIFHPPAATGAGYQGEVDYLLDWQRRRFEWLDAQFSPAP